MNVWVQVLAVVERKVGRHSFDTWFTPVCFQGCDAGTLRLRVPNESFRKGLIDHYAEVLREAIREVVRAPVAVDISAEEPASPLQQQKDAETAERPGCARLNSRYTFESFVTGSSNEFARRVAYVAAEQPSKAYNPLYIYGGPGLGKTHLTQAIGNHIRQKNPCLRLSYMSCENFVNDMITSLSADRMLQFRERYRSIDVLLIDDIQFIAGKQKTQEELLHTFNALYDAQKQIVVTSDCAPGRIPTIEERLHSRFEWGVIADIQPPDLETRIAILRKKAGPRTLPDDVAAFIASRIGSNVRELECALNCLTARASLDGIDDSSLDVGYVEHTLKDLIAKDKKKAATVEEVIAAVSTYYGLRPAQIKAKNNARLIAQPRQVAMFISKEVTGVSLPQIGKDFGGKHHTTVLHSIRKIDKLRRKDPEVSEAISKVIKSFR